jgi:transglutaminase-like putative cysteine protease
MPGYRIVHRTTCRHSSPVSAAWQILHLRPRDEPHQRCLACEIDISPSPGDLSSRTDSFGNTRHLFTLREPHREFSVASTSLVVRGEPSWPMAGLTPPFGVCPELVDAAVREGDFGIEQFRFASSRVPLVDATRTLTDGLDEGDPPLLAWVERLGARFRERMAFDRTATTVSTPLAEALASGRGVCQDFAHIFISCLRGFGLPAAYVSGYLLTRPPPGQSRLLGADASHAWVSIYVPGTGWIDYDPTNHSLAGMHHIVVARGRDYSDISPTKGIFSGGGSHSLSTAVTVEPVADPAD